MIILTISARAANLVGAVSSRALSTFHPAQGKVMCQVAGRESEGWLEEEDIDNFPCEDLRTINLLWLHYSNGKFGFSVQKEIYESLGGTRGYNEEVVEKFGDRVGWRKGGSWLWYSDLTFNVELAMSLCLNTDCLFSNNLLSSRQ